MRARLHRIRQQIPNARWLLSWVVPVPHRPKVYGGAWSDRSRPPHYTHRWVGWSWLGRPWRMRWKPVEDGG